MDSVKCMECPVCYESDAKCHYTCGHSFCYDCTKNWCKKDKKSCPLCRTSICFKGITKLKMEVVNEIKEQTYIDMMSQIMLELSDDYMDVMKACLTNIQLRYNYIMDRYPNVSHDTFKLLLHVTWLTVDYLMNTPPGRLYEPVVHEKYLMISDNEYGVKNI